LSDAHIEEVTSLYESYTEGERSHILPNDAFGYWKITVERPLRVRYDVTNDAVDSLVASSALSKLPGGHSQGLTHAPRELVAESVATASAPDTALQPLYAKLARVPAAVKKAVTAAFVVRDPNAAAVTRKDGYEPDGSLLETEIVAFGEDVDGFLAREVLS